jgi:hypothetical protein
MADGVGPQLIDATSFEQNLAAVWRAESGNQLKQSCLSGPVRTADTENFPLSDIERKILDCNHCAKGFPHTPARQQG